MQKLKFTNGVFLLVLFGLMVTFFQNTEFDVFSDPSQISLLQEEKETDKKEGDIFAKAVLSESSLQFGVFFGFEYRRVLKPDLFFKVPSPPPNYS